jgi:hypothetical protein
LGDAITSRRVGRKPGNGIACVSKQKIQLGEGQ